MGWNHQPVKWNICVGNSANLTFLGWWVKTWPELNGCKCDLQRLVINRSLWITQWLNISDLPKKGTTCRSTVQTKYKHLLTPPHNFALIIYILSFKNGFGNQKLKFKRNIRPRNFHKIYVWPFPQRWATLNRIHLRIQSPPPTRCVTDHRIDFPLDVSAPTKKNGSRKAWWRWSKGLQDPMVRSGNHLDVPLEAIGSKHDGGSVTWVISPQGMISPFFIK